jgi:hypothetical protein
MKQHCPERQILSSRVAKATQDVYRTRITPGDNVLLLQQAREAERLAEREHRAHIQKHGCKP